VVCLHTPVTQRRPGRRRSLSFLVGRCRVAAGRVRLSVRPGPVTLFNDKCAGRTGFRRVGVDSLEDSSERCSAIAGAQASA
jgi:hypothetical protein